MYAEFQKIVGRLIGTGDREEPLAGLEAAGLFSDNGGGDDPSAARNLVAAFLVALVGPEHRQYSKAIQCLDRGQDHGPWALVARFLREGLSLVEREVRERLSRDKDFAESLGGLAVWLDGTMAPNLGEAVGRYHQLFFPEGVGMGRDSDSAASRLRERRTIKLTSRNPEPITSVHEQILFTSNVLLTVPPHTGDEPSSSLPGSLQKRLAEVCAENQLFWYDHPIPMGIEQDRNEAIHGMRGLEAAARFEVARGNMPEDGRLTCVLSVSTTHRGLQDIAREFLEQEFAKGDGIRHLDIHVVTEKDTERLVEEVLIPAAKRYLGPRDLELLREVIGVDGRYGRHYSFLKAVAALWQVFMDPATKGTFKIDLDQVFPQRELVAETGRSAFEHFTTPLWGAMGVDPSGDRVELGMLAGALVNEKDIHKGLFSPDVPFPSEDLAPDQWVFFSGLPQALSTEAEMMTRYGDPGLDGENECIQRVHVTGGTCGILIDCLRRYRPFTPTFVGRAEDQAYVMSVLFSETGPNLRYVHADGLFMRHDKEAFAREAIEAAHLGKVVGDYLRLLLFTGYARSLPWDLDRVKNVLDPFTGCFISRIPVSVVYLRLALKAAALFASGDGKDAKEGAELLRLGAHELGPMARKVVNEPDPLLADYRREQAGWHIYYDALDAVEKALSEGEEFALDLQEKVRRMMAQCRLQLPG